MSTALELIGAAGLVVAAASVSWAFAVFVAAVLCIVAGVLLERRDLDGGD